ncbi:MAG TPA: MarR family transcriptional regulator [Lacipirellulaceae bacterium]|nr:MarR family transcriptional regulator [Lacipirellulaceae bacterium]
MERDIIDDVIKQWRAERPDLDARPLAIVGRILRLAGILERRANSALKPFGLPIWAFDVLGTLRRQGAPFAMTPTALMQSTMLSSGAMTNRIDRLEEQGLVAREPDPDDRRSLRVTLTAAGCKTVERAAAVRLAEAREALRGLNGSERKQLADLLRQCLSGIECSDAPSDSKIRLRNHTSNNEK